MDVEKAPVPREDGPLDEHEAQRVCEDGHEQPLRPNLQCVGWTDPDVPSETMAGHCAA